jgi:general secretion pathway protein D
MAAALTNAIVPSSTNLSGLPPEAVIPKGGLARLQSAPLEQVLQMYSELTGRIILRPNQLPVSAVTLDATAVELTKAEAIQAFDSVLTLNGLTMITVGEKFVTAVPSQQALSEGAAFSPVDPKDLPEAGQFLTKIVKLKHVVPSDVMQLIQGFGKIPNGIVPIDATQTLVLRDYAANIKRMMEILEKVDVEVEADYKLEIIPIKYGKVEDIYSTFSSIVGGGGGGAVGATGTGLARTRGATRTQRGGASRSRFGAQGTMGRQPGQIQPQAAVQPAGQQSTFQQRLQGILSRAGGAGQVELLGDARIVPDERSNSLIVFASKEDMQMITNILDKVDRLLAQVLIEAVIMDVKLTDSKEVGTSINMKEQRTGKFSSAAGSIFGPNLATNLISGVLPSGQLSYYGRFAGDLEVAVKALAASGKGQVLQTPRIQTSHAISASFFTGETVPYITSSYYGGYGYGPSSSFQQLSVGIDLQVTPYITPDGLVVMEIDQNIEELSGYTEISGVGKMPNTTQRRANATVSVQDRDTIILGGYIRTSKSKSRSGIPVLKDIPIVGAVFGSRSEDNSRSELIVLLRPTVLHTPKDAALTAKAELMRLPGVREMEKEMREAEESRQEKADRATGGKAPSTIK